MKIGIIGGGAAGLVAAITAAEAGHQVTVLEHSNRIGKKILLTGNGRCNLTNSDQDLSHFHGGNLDLIQTVLKQCSYADTLSFFTNLGIYTKNKNGCLYPYSEQASAVLEVLRMKLRSLSVEILTDCQVKRLKKEACFIAETNQGQLQFDKLILATGSKAAEQTGSDGSGYALAKAFGHTIIKPLPALVQLRSEEVYFKQLAGIRTQAGLTLYCSKKPVGKEIGELQLTSYGLSGIPTFQLSHLAARALDEGQKVTMQIDFMPDMELTTLTAYLKSRAVNGPDKKAEELLIGILHKNLSLLLVKLSGIKADRRADSVTEQELVRVAELMKQFTVPVSGTNSFREAQVCSGGINTAEITGQLESRLVKGLYFAGEIIDVHGDCGGYNLQWAWSSGMVAGRIQKSD